MKITFISDTHSKHKKIEDDLPGGNLLIHAGDISSMGYNYEIRNFCKWFDGLSNYQNKIFIAGNHDWGFINQPVFQTSGLVELPKETKEILDEFKNITYLRDSLVKVQHNNLIQYTVYGSPWQPEFFDWAFNLPKNGKELETRWNDIPENIDILITHGPAYGKLDQVVGHTEHLGCELLAKRISETKPKIHVCGHIHSGYGYRFFQDTHYINASVLNERYHYANKPLSIEWDSTTNNLIFL
jgi:Icc-related predicted phosphoesterase